MKTTISRFALVAAFFVAGFGCGTKKPDIELNGELRTWHPFSLTFTGPPTDEAAEPNPFTDYRLNVTFSGPAGTQYVVPGYYAADGNAADSSASSGAKWRVHFVPDAAGVWSLEASFRSGANIATDLEPDAGVATSFDGATATFEVQPAVASASGFLGKGMLRYVGKRYMRFAGSGEYFIKGGADSPENLLGYADFDGTEDVILEDKRNRRFHREPFLHTYQPHIEDWREGDPFWKDGKGKGLIGGLNYLWRKGVNSIYFLVQNVGGDGNDVRPWTSYDERFRFDVSKLDQWERVFTHADHLGILLHFVTSETENDDLLDGGELGPERKLFYRELVARFGHHLGVQWNIGEENQNTTAQRKAYCDYFQAIDPYDHPIVLHTNSVPEQHEKHYAPLLGFENFEGASMQIRDDPIVHDVLKDWIRRSAEAGRPWVVAFDEQRTGQDGVEPDSVDPTHEDARRVHLWATLMAGAAGIEWYFGYEYPHHDVNLEDWRSRDKLWDLTRIAIECFHEHLPFWEMESADDLTPADDDYVLAKPGEVYAVYVPFGKAPRLDLSDIEGVFEVHWFNPRDGGPLEPARTPSIEGGAVRSLGSPPTRDRDDWLALVRAR